MYQSKPAAQKPTCLDSLNQWYAWASTGHYCIVGPGTTAESFAFIFNTRALFMYIYRLSGPLDYLLTRSCSRSPAHQSTALFAPAQPSCHSLQFSVSSASKCTPWRSSGHSFSCSFVLAPGPLVYIHSYLFRPDPSIISGIWSLLYQV